jgi:ribonuclease HI
MVQGKNLILVLGSTKQFSRQKCMPLQHAQLRNLDKNYKNRNIYNPSDSQATIKALGKYQITSKLDWDYHQSFIQLAKHNIIQLIWVPGREGTAGNETAHQLARMGSEHPFIGPKPACGTSVGFTKKAVRDWSNINHKKHWEFTTGLKQAKGLIIGPSARRMKWD